MILIADSGSTKTEWCLADQGRPVRTVVTAGINPFFQTREEIAGEIRDALLPALKGERIHLLLWRRLRLPGEEPDRGRGDYALYPGSHRGV